MTDNNIKKILIIEDEYAVRSSIRELLEENNYKVFSASDGVEGIQLAKAIMPNLIICDIMMPKLTGYEVIEELRKEQEFTSIPFIFLTAKAELTDFRSGMELGADDYITKPYRATNLLKAVKIRLSKFEAYQSNTAGKAAEDENHQTKTLTENNRIFLKTKTGPQLINISDIFCVSAHGEYSTTYLSSGEKYLVRKLIKEWEQQLPAKTFVRIHRSTIINVNHIEKIEKWYKRSYLVTLKNFEENLVISQRYAALLKDRLSL